MISFSLRGHMGCAAYHMPAAEVNAVPKPLDRLGLASLDAPLASVAATAQPWGQGSTLFAPAKVNLSLRVVGRRPDGYHLLESVLVPVTLFDAIHVRKFVSLDANCPAAISVQTDRREIPAGPGNLAFAAAAAFAETARVSFQLALQIEKRIPAGAGLGGGSSDAAAVLLGLNRSFGTPLDARALNQLALRLGADVPFFLSGAPAHISGIGECVAPYTGEVPRDLVLCGDGHGLATRDVFASYDAALTSAGAQSSVADPAGAGGASAGFYNDLESAAIRLHPGILVLKQELSRRGASATLMTGSGSVVFGVVEGREVARQLAAELRASGYWSEAVRSIRRPAPWGDAQWAVAKR